LDKYTAAVLSAPPSALLYANRANALLKLQRPLAAERDCDLALAENPDSAKALRMRGQARKALGKWEEALHDLSAAQQIDFDESVVHDLKELTDKHIAQELAEAAERNEQHDRLHKKAEEIKKAQEEAKKEARATASASSARGMPGGMPFGMGGMPGMDGGGGMPAGAEGLMGALMSDPELMASMQNPKVMAAFQELMSGPAGPMGLLSNPAKLQELMADPEVGPVLQKLMAKMGGGMGGGMGGMPGGGAAAANDDDIPDLDDLPDLE
jgi:suppressor of tumorigenicity protein 13